MQGTKDQLAWQCNHNITWQGMQNKMMEGDTSVLKVPEVMHLVISVK